MVDHQSTQPAWRREPDRGRARLRRLQIGVAWISLFVFSALLLWASTWLSPPRPAQLVLLGAGYQDNLVVPQNVYGWHSLASLAELTQSTGVFSFWGANLLSLPHGPLEVRSDTPWDASLKDVDQRTVVLYITLHGAADEQGAFLVTADATGDGDAKQRLRLATVLDRMAKLPAHKQKVLLLDATQMTSNWRLGVLENNFVGQLKRLESQIIAIPNLIVLCASDAGERSWVCDEWRQTIYSHYVIEGLKGAATDLGNDGRINAWELHRFVQANVQGWVQANRAAVQTPLLLPMGEEGQRRASLIDLSVVRRGYQPPAPSSVPEFEVPAELVDAWKEHHRLADQNPPPWAYSPQSWRLYQDLLLRFEQLLQAGDRDWAVRLQHRLHELAAHIEHARMLELASISNTLTMPAAAGCDGVLPDTDVQRTASDLWNAAPEEAAKVWQAALARLGADDLARRLLRLHVSGWLLERATEDPDTHLASVVRLLEVIRDPLYPRPAEAHFAVMLQRDKPASNGSSESTELVRLALSVRCLAEQAALCSQLAPRTDGADTHHLAQSERTTTHSEFLCNTIAPQIAIADEHRRLGEDLLLATSREWPQARQELEAARAGYLGVFDTGRQIQTALAVRDHVLSMLPYYSYCVAYRLNCHHANSDEVVNLLLRLWHDTHDLCQRLDNLRPTDALSLGEQADRVRRSYDDARNRLCRWWQELSSAEVPSVWHEADAALLAPHRDWELRMKLLENKRRTSRRLFIETAQLNWRKADLRAAEAQNPPALRHIGQEGFLALAVLGQHLFDAASGAGLETYDQVHRRLEVFPVEQDWQQSLAKAGTQIAIRWRRIPTTIEKLVSESRQAEQADALRLLTQADRLTRQIDACGAQDLTADPVVACRRLRMQGLLLWQAERTLADRWYGEDPQATPYFQLAGAVWMNDAQPLDGHTAPLASARERYAAARPLSLQGNARLRLTTQTRQELIYRLDNSGSLAGFPVLWVEPSTQLDIEFPQPGMRLVKQIAADRAPGLVTCTLACPELAQAEIDLPSTPSVEATAVTVRGLFRGQRLEAVTPIELHPAADTMVSLLPLPQRGSLAVRADAKLLERFGAANGHVAIVLDCSGSMGPARGQSFQPTTKFAEATAALKQVLGRLPRGTTVSVWVFGQAVGAQKTVEPVERTIRRVYEPARWDPDDAGQLAQLMARLEYPALEPWNESPIVSAILAAKEDLADVAGFRTLLVLTDGMDNRFEKQGAKQDIPTTLRSALQGTGIVVNVIGFKVAGQEAAHAQRQFAVVETLDPPGKLVTVDEAGELATALDAALRQRLQYRVEDFSNAVNAARPQTELDVSRSGANDQWFPGGLSPGSFRVRAIADAAVAAETAINRGDALLLRLSETAGRLKFSRLDWTKSDFPWKPHTESMGWRLSAMQNQSTPQRGLRMLLALEKLSSEAEGVLQIIRPREVWLEVQPRETDAEAPIMRWHYLPGYPAAVWQMESPNWPLAADGASPARPRVQAWFNADQETPPAATLRRQHDFVALGDLIGRPVRVSDQEVRLEQVSVERHVVETRAGVRQPQSCLVVRLSHAPGNPVWARVAGIHAAGQEHRYFSTLGSYTGLFWPVTSDEAELALSSVSLISLEEFKRDAQKRGCYLKLDDLPPPSPDDFAPRPAVEAP